MMTKREALKYFGGRQADLARALGIERQAVWKWKDDEPIPELRELQLRHNVLPEIERHRATNNA